jgi:hypothetical protein
VATAGKLSWVDRTIEALMVKVLDLNLAIDGHLSETHGAGSRCVADCCYRETFEWIHAHVHLSARAMYSLCFCPERHVPPGQRMGLHEKRPGH